MRNKFDEQLRLLNELLLHMGYTVQDAIQKATKALLSQDVETAKIIMAGDAEVDQEQKNIENLCFQLMIQQQPVARDLRFITAAMKMVTDMERIGDQAADISELTVMMAEKPYIMKSDDIRAMSMECIEMLVNAIQSYVDKDVEKAQSVINQDDIVDNLFLKIKGELIEIMKTEPEYEEQAADLLMVNKYLERIGDHATNIAEWVIFSLDSRIQKEV